MIFQVQKSMKEIETRLSRLALKHLLLNRSSFLSKNNTKTERHLKEKEEDSKITGWGLCNCWNLLKPLRGPYCCILIWC
jgi:hypothetical protein